MRSLDKKTCNTYHKLMQFNSEAIKVKTQLTLVKNNINILTYIKFNLQTITVTSLQDTNNRPN